MPPLRADPGPPRAMLYGATGFSGTLIAEAARQRRLPLLLAGRDAGRLSRVARRLHCPHRVLPLDEPEPLAAALAGVEVVLNAAGPFAATAPPLLEACLRSGTHYLDIAGELPVLELLARCDGEARARGVMVMPAVGFVAVPSDCLAAHVARRLPGAQRLTIAISRTDAVSRGSMKTILANRWDTAAVRRAGRLAALPTGALERRIDYGGGPRRSLAVSWADLVTAHHSTGIADIEVLLEVSPSERALIRLGGPLRDMLAAPMRELLAIPLELALPGPTPRQRGAGSRVVVAEARDRRGGCVRARLRTPDAYAFTAASAVAVVEQVLGGEWRAGFETAGRLYGPDFVLTLAGVAREDLTA